MSIKVELRELMSPGFDTDASLHIDLGFDPKERVGNQKKARNDRPVSGPPENNDVVIPVFGQPQNSVTR